MGISNDLRYMDRGRVPWSGQMVNLPGRGTPRGRRGELPLQHFAHLLLIPRSSEPHKASTIEHSKERGGSFKMHQCAHGGWGGNAALPGTSCKLDVSSAKTVSQFFSVTHPLHTLGKSQHLDINSTLNIFPCGISKHNLLYYIKSSHWLWWPTTGSVF